MSSIHKKENEASDKIEAQALNQENNIHEKNVGDSDQVTEDSNLNLESKQTNEKDREEKIDIGKTNKRKSIAETNLDNAEDESTDNPKKKNLPEKNIETSKEEVEFSKLQDIPNVSQPRFGITQPGSNPFGNGFGAFNPFGALKENFEPTQKIETTPETPETPSFAIPKKLFGAGTSLGGPVKLSNGGLFAQKQEIKESDAKSEHSTNGDDKNSFQDLLDSHKEDVPRSNSNVPLLTQFVEVNTGEEDEKKVHGLHGKLLVYENTEWIDRGVGPFSLLQSKLDETKFRIVMRNQYTKKLILNAPLFKGMAIKADTNALRFTAFHEMKRFQFALRAKPDDIKKMDNFLHTALDKI